MSADTPSTTTLLCDADGNLFPSEEPAFVASAVVTNAFLAGHGVDVRFDPEALRLQTTGKNFRTTMADLAVSYGIVVTREEREHWVTEEREAVTRHLSMTLRPDRRVIEPLTRLGEQTLLAAASSSATARLAACFEATGLSALIPEERRFSAEDSLGRPTSKPDPAIYRFACECLNVEPAAALAVEDSLPGAKSAVAAGIPTVGNVQFVPPNERQQRERQLRQLGVLTVVGSWTEIESLLLEPGDGPGLLGRCVERRGIGGH